MRFHPRRAPVAAVYDRVVAGDAIPGEWKAIVGRCCGPAGDSAPGYNGAASHERERRNFDAGG